MIISFFQDKFITFPSIIKLIIKSLIKEQEYDLAARRVLNKLKIFYYYPLSLSKESKHSLLTNTVEMRILQIKRYLFSPRKKGGEN